MKKYILIMVVGISVFLGVTLLQAVVEVYPHMQLRVRNQAIEVSWEYPDEGLWDGYKVYYDIHPIGPSTTNFVPAGPGSRWAKIDGLDNGYSYYVVVVALLGEAESQYSSEEVVTPAPADTSVERSISGGTTVAAYTMISTPVEPEDTRMSAVLGTDLGPYDNTQWRCFHWESDEGVYEEGTSSNDMGPDRGQPLVGHSAWLISRNDATIHSTGCPYDYNNTRDYKIYLAPGWNQIGCPFTFEVAWSNVMVTDGDDVWNASNPNPFCGEIAWFWDNGAYYAVINLVPMHGCFVYNKTEDDIALIVPHPHGGEYFAGERYSVEGDRANYNLERTPSYETSSESPPPPPAGFVSADLSSGGGGCFIATAAFGTPMAEEVRALSKFRDEHLLITPPGRSFVKFYYKTSPPIADFIRNKPILKTVVRIGLKPLIWLSNKKAE